MSDDMDSSGTNAASIDDYFTEDDASHAISGAENIVRYCEGRLARS